MREKIFNVSAKYKNILPLRNRINCYRSIIVRTKSASQTLNTHFNYRLSVVTIVFASRSLLLFRFKMVTLIIALKLYTVCSDCICRSGTTWNCKIQNSFSRQCFQRVDEFSQRLYVCFPQMKKKNTNTHSHTLHILDKKSMRTSHAEDHFEQKCLLVLLLSLFCTQLSTSM